MHRPIYAQSDLFDETANSITHCVVCVCCCSVNQQTIFNLHFRRSEMKIGFSAKSNNKMINSIISSPSKRYPINHIRFASHFSYTFFMSFLWHFCRHGRPFFSLENTALVNRVEASSNLPKHLKWTTHH